MGFFSNWKWYKDKADSRQGVVEIVEPMPVKIVDSLENIGEPVISMCKSMIESPKDWHIEYSLYEKIFIHTPSKQRLYMGSFSSSHPSINSWMTEDEWKYVCGMFKQ